MTRWSACRSNGELTNVSVYVGSDQQAKDIGGRRDEETRIECCQRPPHHCSSLGGEQIQILRLYGGRGIVRDKSGRPRTGGFNRAIIRPDQYRNPPTSSRVSEV